MTVLVATAAAFPFAGDRGELPSVLVPGLLLAGVLLVAAAAIGIVRHWRGRLAARGQGERLSASAQLAQFRSLYEQGAMSQEEFDRVRALLGGQIRRDLQMPGPQPAAGQVKPARPEAPTETPAPPPAPPPSPSDDGIRPA
jgi:hypothetical protein